MQFNGCKNSDSYPSGAPKKLKAVAYDIKLDIKKLIKADEENKKLWKEGLACAKEGQQVSEFVAKSVIKLLNFFNYCNA